MRFLVWRAQVYDGQRFAKGGFRMHELFFHDGTCPSEAILQAFLAIAEAEPGEGSFRVFSDRVLWGVNVAVGVPSGCAQHAPHGW